MRWWWWWWWSPRWYAPWWRAWPAEGGPRRRPGPVVWLRCRCRWWCIVGVSVQLTHRGAASPRLALRRRWTPRSLFFPTDVPQDFPKFPFPPFLKNRVRCCIFVFGSTTGLRLAWLRGLRIFFFSSTGLEFEISRSTGFTTQNRFRPALEDLGSAPASHPLRPSELSGPTVFSE